MRSAMTRRAEIRRVTTYFMNTILFSRQTTYFMYMNLLLLTQLLQNWKGISVLRGWRQAVSLPSHGVNRDLSQKRQNVSVSPPAQARCINSTRKSKFTPCDSATFLLFQKNKAGYTNRHQSRIINARQQKKKCVTDQRTDGTTDRRMDRTSYRVAYSRLKRKRNNREI